MGGGAEVALQRLGLVVGRIVAVEDHPGSRAPSYRLTVEVGPGGRCEATLPAASYGRQDLLNRQVVCMLEGEEALVVAARSHAQGLVLLAPDREVEDGTAVA